MEFIFWLCIGLIGFSYIAFPLVLILATKLFGKKNSKRNITEITEWPEVAVVIAAFNEEQDIKQRVENLLEQDYPADKITYYIGSDGSTDKTNEILSEFTDSRLNAQLFEVNRGKASVLNNLIELVEQPVIIFSDANTHFESDAIKRLVAHFEDDKVGAVCGELNLFNSGGNDNKDSTYWRYEQFLKDKEGQLDALLGANGAIYAIRSHLYTPIPANTVVDDFLIVMNVAKAKYRIIYDKEALAHEEIAPSIAEESKRRIRIGTGNYQAFTRLYWALNPLIGWRFFSYFSHKVLRWFTPHLMIIVLMSNVILIGDTLYNTALLIQIIAYFVAIWGQRMSDKGMAIPSSVALLTFFVSMNFALLQGFYRFAFKNVKGTWQRTSR
ncbi:MAG: glycosyltransferase family 2 protein [Colwellia sp.]|nr:glycosyltransferase family 2 protein [Colwellia sp.]